MVDEHESDSVISDSFEDQKTMALRDAGPDFVKRDNCNWRSEDATVEVWSEKTDGGPGFDRVKGLAWMIELSLHENGVGTHIHVSQNGFRRIFVRPEDEPQARETVHEIESGTPPA